MVQLLAQAIEQPNGPAGVGEPLFASAAEVRGMTERDELVEVWPG